MPGEMPGAGGMGATASGTAGTTASGTAGTTASGAAGDVAPAPSGATAAGATHPGPARPRLSRRRRRVGPDHAPVLGTAGRSGAPRAGRRWEVLWCLLLAVLGLTVTSLAVENGPSLSVLDEQTHLDYVWKIHQGELPHAGSDLSPFVRQEWSCRGQAGFDLPPCAEAAGTDPAAYPGGGENYNFWHPPGYYAVTAALTGAVTTLLPDRSFTGTARMTGGLWLVAALVAMYAVLRIWRLPRWLSAASAATMLAVPSLLHASSIVTNDAPAALIGVAAAWLLTRVFRQQRLGWAVPTVVAVLAASTKLMSTVSVLTAVGLVGLSAVGALRRREWGEAGRRLAVAVGPVLGVAAVAAGWSAFQAGRAVPGWRSPIAGLSTEEPDGLPFDEWAPTLTEVFGLVGDDWVQPALSSLALVGWVGVLGVLFTAAPFVGLTAFDRGRAERVFGWAALIGVIAVPLLVQGRELLKDGFFPHVTSRYGLTLVPVTIACLALVAREQKLRVAAVAVPVVGYLLVTLSFAGVL
ncbi:hypothetical protein MF406_05825 [Georgenia sp. TF02-10]|uniref:hypothetical protein n=1 Tax=Georgenia sp. TF02-10 TaxID=2917725 RepID=UPI001FA6F8C5|nr:hypothetical protein [Georgenia sp. TF02-10]UNX55753.1 hypothetical protein MF406_05825 [Georgenia sp. TF02-10]